MIRLYAFVGGLHGLLPDGLGAVGLDSILAIVGPDVDDPAAQGTAVQSLLEVADAVLPARYGERFGDVQALIDAATPKVPELTERLAGVDGCVELVVRASRPDRGDERRAGDGAAYMRTRLRRVTSDAAVAAALDALLRPHARCVAVSETVLSRLVHDASYLVERPAVDTFAACLRGYAAAHPELSLVCSGPWAPATFAEAA